MTTSAPLRPRIESTRRTLECGLTKILSPESRRKTTPQWQQTPTARAVNFFSTQCTYRRCPSVSGILRPSLQAPTASPGTGPSNLLPPNPTGGETPFPLAHQLSCPPAETRRRRTTTTTVQTLSPSSRRPVSRPSPVLGPSHNHHPASKPPPIGSLRQGCKSITTGRERESKDAPHRPAGVAAPPRPHRPAHHRSPRKMARRRNPPGTTPLLLHPAIPSSSPAELLRDQGRNKASFPNERPKLPVVPEGRPEL